MSKEINNLKTTNMEFELNDGEKINLVINFSLLYQLRSKNKSIYDKYSKTILVGSEDLFDFIQIIYVAYLCANIDSLENCMSFDTFIEKMPNDVRKIAEVAGELTQPKKK